jgi:alkanesulfonate monooxygenase SsuD/methylene tetrahydromethanopterin reductase-like flavin-dependent oxidoreductase (luciferase family)
MIPTLMEFEPCGFDRLKEAAQLAEEHGFEALWVGDHLLFSAPILDATVAVAMLAALAERVRVGTNVLQLPLRRPVDVAKAYSTLSYLTGGRAILGVGVGGGFLPEWDAAGVDPTKRGALCDAAIEALGWYWEGTRHTGEYWHSPGVPMQPEPVGGRVPIWVGGRVDAAIRRAARCDGTLNMWVSPRRYHQIRERIVELRGDLDGFTIGLELLACIDDDVDRARYRVREQLRRLHLDPDRLEKYTAYGPPDRVAGQIAEYESVGVDHVSVYLPTQTWSEAAFRLATEVMPMVGVTAAPQPGGACPGGSTQSSANPEQARSSEEDPEAATQHLAAARTQRQ